ncbi:hypothetical protein [Thiocapsa sp.]|uniref:hypothetical protein n=1 Tax=Thiocapsa sp. TaxID=2024551 RepID=UPI00359470B1
MADALSGLKIERHGMRSRSVGIGCVYGWYSLDDTGLGPTLMAARNLNRLKLPIIQGCHDPLATLVEGSTLLVVLLPAFYKIADRDVSDWRFRSRHRHSTVKDEMIAIQLDEVAASCR